MSDLRTAAQQALEALVTAEAGLADIGDADREQGDDVAWCEARAAAALEGPRAAITALRAALAQPLPDPVDEYRKGFIDGQIDMRDRPEEQAPVARVIDDETPEGSTEWILCSGRQVPVKTGDLLYTHPPRREWRSLSEEEIEDMSVTGTDSELRRQQFARAVEQALKEKNHE